MKVLDITIDLETCSLKPTAAVMRIGAVAWDRNGIDTPFFPEEENLADNFDYDNEFASNINLSSMFVDGFSFDQDTADWWARQNDDAKKHLVNTDDLADIQIVIIDFFDWIEAMKERHGADEVYLWSQGSDFDISILRNICYKYNVAMPVRYTNVRDHRTFYLEGARTICDLSEVEFDPKKAYCLVDDYEGEGEPHNPIFDCKRSIYSTWQMMKHLRCIEKCHNK